MKPSTQIGKIGFLLLLPFLVSLIQEGTVNKPVIPFPRQLEGWELKSKPDVYIGDDLFLYINGGADIYHEYGFSEVMSGEYEKTGIGRISVEVYTMNSPVSAFGIFSFRTGGKWDITTRGTLYLTEEYYQNILLGEHLITITAIDINPGTKEAITMFRDVFEASMAAETVFPEPVLELAPRKFEKTVYFKGDLGLMNIYNLLSSGTGIRDGAAGISSDRTTLLLRLKEGDEPKRKLAELINTLKKTGRYVGFSTEKETIRFSDKNSNRLTLNIYKNHLILNIDKYSTSD